MRSALGWPLERRPDVALDQRHLQRAAERDARPRESRHHRADGNPDDIGQFAVGQLFELAQHEQLMKRIRQTAHRSRDDAGVVGLEQ